MISVDCFVLIAKGRIMKKMFLMLMTLGCALVNAQSQDYVVADLDGNAYENNSVHVFNIHGTFEDPMTEAKLHLVVNNNGAQQIRVTAEVVEMTNADGELAQFCIGGPAGNCYFPIYEGSFYPNAVGGIIEPASNWGYNDYFINLSSTNLAEYKLRFVQKDDAGNEIPNTNTFLTYRYDNTMSVSDVNSIAIAQVSPTVIKGQTNVTLKENASVQVLNLEGKSVKSLKMNSGTSQLDFSGLSAGVYLIQFKGVSGKTTTTKVVVK